MFVMVMAMVMVIFLVVVIVVLILQQSQKEEELAGCCMPVTLPAPLLKISTPVHHSIRGYRAQGRGDVTFVGIHTSSLVSFFFSVSNGLITKCQSKKPRPSKLNTISLTFKETRKSSHNSIPPQSPTPFLSPKSHQNQKK